MLEIRRTVEIVKGSLYAVRTKSGWQLRVSLDLRIDLLWWMDRDAHALYLLSEELPFGWAVEARDTFQAFSEMDRWSHRAWDQYLMRTLQEELKRMPGGLNRWSRQMKGA